MLPLLVAALSRARALWVAIAAIFAIEAVAIAARLDAFPLDREGIPMVTHLRWHGLFIGLLLAYIALRHNRLWARLGALAPWLGIAGVLGTIAVMATTGAPPSRWMFVVVPTLGTWTMAMVFLPCVHPVSRWSRISFPGLRYAGELTYSLYLVHAVIPKAWLGDKVTASPVTGFAVRFALMVGCAMLLHHLIERPALWLRARTLAAWDARRNRSESEPQLRM